MKENDSNDINYKLDEQKYSATTKNNSTNKGTELKKSMVMNGIIDNNDEDKDKQCVKCKEENMKCPTCPEGTVCTISTRTCYKCSTVSCIPINTPNQNTLSKDGTIISGSSGNAASGANLLLIIGIIGAILLVVITLICIFARRSLKRQSHNPNPKYGNTSEKHNLISKEPPKLELRTFHRFNPFAKKNRSKKPSVSFSMLNFECYDEGELEEEMTFEEMLQTDPNKYKNSSSLKEPKEPQRSLSKKKVKVLDPLQRKNTNQSTKSNFSNSYFSKESSNILISEQEGSRRVQEISDYTCDFGDIFQGFDLSMIHEEDSHSFSSGDVMVFTTREKC